MGSHLYPLKGIVIHSSGESDSIFLTFPIIGEDWQVADCTCEYYDPLAGFEDNIIGSKGDTVSIAHPAWRHALDFTVGQSTGSIYNMFIEAAQRGIHLSDTRYHKMFSAYDQLSGSVHLYVEHIECDSCSYRIGQHYEDWQREFPLPQYIFTTDKNDSREDHFSIDAIHEYIWHILHNYSSHFERNDIRLYVHISKDKDAPIPKDIQRKLKRMEKAINDLLT